MTVIVCPACALPVSEGPPGLLGLLGRYPAGIDTSRLAKQLRRRRAGVLAELQAAESAGSVERLGPAGRSHARRWRLAEAASAPPGAAPEQRPGAATHPAAQEHVSPDLKRSEAPTLRPESAGHWLSDREALALVLAAVVLAAALGAAVALLVRGAGR